MNIDTTFDDDLPVDLQLIRLRGFTGIYHRDCILLIDIQGLNIYRDTYTPVLTPVSSIVLCTVCVDGNCIV